MRLLIGMPEADSWGGPNACEPPFVEALRKLLPDIGEERYVFNDKLQKVKNYRRVLRVLRVGALLRRRIRREHFDIVHINTAFDRRALLRDVATVTFLIGCRTRIFLKCHGSAAKLLKKPNFLQSILSRYLVRRVSGIGVLSSEEKSNFLNAGYPEEKIFVIKNAVVPLTTNASWVEIKDSKRAARLLFVARFIATKGLLETIRACNILRNAGIDFDLTCVGDGPVRDEAEKEVRRLGLDEKVRFTGYLNESDVSSFYMKSDLLLFPTFHEEGFPMVIFNAAAAGLPVITTKIRAAADYLKEPDNCIWVEPRNPEDLAKKAALLLRNPAQAARMGQNNRRLVSQFAPDIVAGEYMEVYKKIMNTAGEASRHVAQGSPIAG